MIYNKGGLEFGERMYSIAIIICALYVLITSAERFRTMLVDFLRTLGFIPSRFDRDIWMRLRDSKDVFDYICTHIDDFKVVEKDPQMWVDRIATVFLVKEHGPRNCYLSNDYTYHDDQDAQIYGVQTYAEEAVTRIERMCGCLPKKSTPIPVTNCHPELDTSQLYLDDHHKYQMFLGILQQMLTIGKPVISQLVSFLNRFGACPREGHLDLAIQSFG